MHKQHEETLALKGDEYSRMLGETKNTMQEENSAAEAKLLSEVSPSRSERSLALEGCDVEWALRVCMGAAHQNDELRKQHEELECSKRVGDTEALKVLTELNDHKAVVKKLNGTVATNEVNRLRRLMLSSCADNQRG